MTHISYPSVLGHLPHTQRLLMDRLERNHIINYILNRQWCLPIIGAYQGQITRQRGAQASHLISPLIKNNSEVIEHGGNFRQRAATRLGLPQW